MESLADFAPPSGSCLLFERHCLAAIAKRRTAQVSAACEFAFEPGLQEAVRPETGGVPGNPRREDAPSMHFHAPMLSKSSLGVIFRSTKLSGQFARILKRSPSSAARPLSPEAMQLRHISDAIFKLANSSRVDRPDTLPGNPLFGSGGRNLSRPSGH
jgi:hypothetical protein